MTQIVAALVPLAVACVNKDEPAPPESRSDSAGSATRMRPPRTETITIHAPAPEGLDARLWQEIGWLSADTVGLSEFTRPEVAAVVQWAASIAPESPNCSRALHAVDHYFLVRTVRTQGPPTHVLYGDSRRDDLEACAAALDLGGPVRVTTDGPFTSIESTESTMWLGFGATPAGPVIVAAPQRKAVARHLLASAGLVPTAPLVDALRQVDRRADTWSAAGDDATTDLLGVPSQAYALSISSLASESRSPIVAQAWARFSDADAAQQAQRELEALRRRYEADRATPLDFTLSRTADDVALRATARVPTIAVLAELQRAAARR